jgi:hypothetical protein
MAPGSRCRREAHAAADPQQAHREAARVELPQHVTPFAWAARDRIDLLVRPGARPDEEVIDPPEPGHLQELVLRHLEDEGAGRPASLPPGA